MGHSASSTHVVVNLQIERVFPDPGQPRKHFDQVALKELEASIKENGLKNPIHVRPALTQEGNETFLIVAGERRWRCVKNLGHVTIPAFIMPPSIDAYLFALIDNLQRESLDPIEEAHGYQALVQRGLTQTAIAQRMGRSQSHISHMLLLVQLPSEIQQAIVKNRLSSNAGIEIARRCLTQEEMLQVFTDFRTRSRNDSQKMTIAALKTFLNRRDRIRKLIKEGGDTNMIRREMIVADLKPSAIRLFGILDECAGYAENIPNEFKAIWMTIPAKDRPKILQTLRGITQRIITIVQQVEEENEE